MVVWCLPVSPQEITNCTKKYSCSRIIVVVHVLWYMAGTSCKEVLLLVCSLALWYMVTYCREVLLLQCAAVCCGTWLCITLAGRSYYCSADRCVTCLCRGSADDPRSSSVALHQRGSSRSTERPWCRQAAGSSRVDMWRSRSPRRRGTGYRRQDGRGAAPLAPHTTSLQTAHTQWAVFCAGRL